MIERVDGFKSRNISWNRKMGGQTARDIAQRADADRQSDRGREVGQRYGVDP